jgi:hypothetical protein
MHKTRDIHRSGTITLLHIQDMLIFYVFESPCILPRAENIFVLCPSKFKNEDDKNYSSYNSFFSSKG